MSGGAECIGSTSSPCRQRWRLLFLVTAAILAVLSCIDAPKYAYMGGSLWLQHIGTSLLLLILLVDLKLRTLSLGACFCLFLFTGMHILGARYLYSNVPYDEWARDFLGWQIELPKTHANQYDRLVHFAFGLLLMPMFRQFAERWLKLRKYAQSLLFAWLMVQTFSMLYEVFEWGLSEWMNKELADGYNGQQGDVWDAQKDMFLAMLGSTVVIPVMAVCRMLRSRKGPRGER